MSSGNNTPTTSKTQRAQRNNPNPTPTGGATPNPAQGTATVTVVDMEPVVDNNPLAGIAASAGDGKEPGSTALMEQDLMSQLTKMLFEGTSILSKLNPSDFEMFGKMSSHEYRKLFFKVTKDLSAEARIWIIILFTAIKSKPRVLTAMNKFSDMGWFRPTKEFIMNRMVQYTVELTSDQTKFAAVHVPHIMPSFTAVCWVKITAKKDQTVDNFLSNLWACQLDLPLELMNRQRAWETDFWNNKVKKTRNLVKGREELKFHDEFWETKAADKYPFLIPNGKEFKVSNEADLVSWISQWSAFSS